MHTRHRERAYARDLVRATDTDDLLEHAAAFSGDVLRAIRRELRARAVTAERESDRALIRRVQAQHGASIAALARLVGVTPRTVRRWLDGTRSMSEPARKLLATL